MIMAYATIPPKVRICSLPGSNRVTFLTIRHNIISRAGPDAKAEARKRAAMMAVNQ
jgi:hypothetical protein